MRFLQYRILTFLFFCSCLLPSLAKDYKDTLRSTANDIITIRYSITENSGRMTIQIHEVKKMIGFKHKEKSDDVTRYKILFFNKVGTYENDKFKTSIDITPITISTDDLRYQSKEDYIWLENNTKIELELLVDQATLRIPVFLVYYKKAHTYEVLSECGNFEILLSRNTSRNAGRESAPQPRTQEVSITQEIDVEEPLTPIQEAQICIEHIESGLTLSDLSPLDTYVNRLRELEISLQAPQTKQQIREILQRYEDRKKEIEDSIKAQREHEIKIAKESEARNKMAYVRDRLENIEKLSESDLAGLKNASNELRELSYEIDDSQLSTQMKHTADECDDALTKIETDKKRRNIWLIIGGVLLLILMFIGNQALQHYRNVQNIRNMEDAQNKMVQRAEADARQRSQQMAYSARAKGQGQAQQAGQNIARGGNKSKTNTIRKGKGNNKGNSSITI